LENGAKFNIFENLNGSWPNRSLNLTLPRAEFLVRREYSKGSMLSLKQVLGNYTKNVNATEVHNPPSSENDFGGQAGAARRVYLRFDES